MTSPGPQLHLHRNHCLDGLADALADVLRTPAGSPFDPEWVVVSGRPAERWLTNRLADRLGVCANVRFLSPSTLVEEVVERTLGVRTADVRAWRGERLQWAVLAALRTLGDADGASPLRRYVGDAGPGSARALQLARTIAGCFERYIAARPELVRAWDEGRDDADAPDAWQPALWRAVAAHLAGAEHVVALLDRAVARLAAEGPPPRLPRRIAWLAQGAAPRLPLDAAAALARAGTEVHLLVQTATRAAVGEAPGASAARPRHPLLASLARESREAVQLIDEAARRGGAATWRVVPSAGAAGSDTVLARLQHDLLDDVARGPHGEPPLALPPEDASVRVHVCHGRARQVDALRDALLRAFDEDPTLMPRDVLVLTPDVAAFGPLVEAAFEAWSDGVPRIPVSVADRPVRADNPAADVALRLLELAAGRVDAVALLDFLCLPAVSARFALGVREHEALRRWAREAGARWGIDAAHREAHALPADAEHTWRFALDRLLVGWALPGAERALFAGTLPYDEIEGQDAELLGRLAEACARTFEAVRDLAAPRAVPAWCAALDRALDRLVDEETTAVPRLALAAELRALRDEARAAAELPIDLAALRLLLEARLDAPSAAGAAPGGVMVAALRVGRVVPARVVCLLGMDEETFPRPRGGVGFDRVARTPLPGDADPAVEDRQRFLDAVLAARERLVITYAGRTLDTNAPVAPAVPVAELLDVLDATFAPVRSDDGRTVPARTRVMVEHPLQPFSARNFVADAPADRARSHDHAWLAAARALAGDRRPCAPFICRGVPDDARAGGERVVHVDDLARFLANPAESLLTRRLRVRLGTGDELETREPATLGGLEAHGLRGQVLASVLAGHPIDERTFERARGAGRLPHGAVARLELDAAARDARRIVRAMGGRVPEGRRRDAAVDHVVDGWRLVGTVGPRHGEGGLLVVQPGELRARQIVAAWARHLALHLAADGQGVESWIVGKAPKPKRSGTEYPLGICVLRPVQEPVARLGELLALYERGRTAPLPFFPATSYAYAKALRGPGDPDPDMLAHALDAARREFGPTYVSGVTESEDAYVARAFAGTAPLDHPDFPLAALAVWRPLRDHLHAPTS